MFGFKKKDNGKAPLGRFAHALSVLLGRHASSDFDDDFFDELSDLLVEADLGASLSWEFIEELQRQRRRQRINSRVELLQSLRTLLQQSLRSTVLSLGDRQPQVILLVGVNGVGKTTSLAKLAYYYQQQGIEKIVFGAGDTFRAAACEQLEQHAARLGVRLVTQHHGSDPAAVLHDTVSSACSRSEQLVLLDTAGRMHSQDNLMNQLRKIDRVLDGLIDRKQRHNLLVLDATTGQNAFQQAEVFHQAIGVDALLLSKLDSSASGGMAVSIGHKLGLPFAFWGGGEGYEHLYPFNSEEYLDGLFAGL